VLARLAVDGDAYSSASPKVLVFREDLLIGSLLIKQLFVQGLSGECRMEDEPPEATIIRTTNVYVLLTVKLTDSKTSRRDGWSSKTRVLQFNLQMLISMRRQVRGEDNCGARFMASSSANSSEFAIDGGRRYMGFVEAVRRRK
jgi:hypothetical protein